MIYINYKQVCNYQSTQLLGFYYQKLTSTCVDSNCTYICNITNKTLTLPYINLQTNIQYTFRMDNSAVCPQNALMCSIQLSQ
jgi:membrane-bound inhibitor of C-type lysozyme